MLRFIHCAVFLICILATPQSYGFDPFFGLSTSRDARNYKNVFELQRVGSFEDADKVIATLSDQSLLGHVYFDRYMHPNYKSSYTEIADWMDLYNYHPGASKLYSLAQSRRPVEEPRTLKKPQKLDLKSGFLESRLTRPEKREYVTYKTDAKTVKSKVKSLLGQGNPSQALKILLNPEHETVLSNTQKQDLRARIAFSYLIQGKVNEAQTQAKLAGADLKNGPYLTKWVSGLTAWHKGTYKQAAKYFGQSASIVTADAWQRAAAYFWAARAHAQMGNIEAYEQNLIQAGTYTRTFYGLLALESLGQDLDFNWSLPKWQNSVESRLLENKLTAEAIGLYKAEQYGLADQMMRHALLQNEDGLKDDILVYALHSRLPLTALYIGNRHKEDRFTEAALYPLLHPEILKNAHVDEALIHAFIRRESRFQYGAESYVGAFGLMQLIPSTASYVLDKQFKNDGALKYYLQHPQNSIGAGSKYLDYLLDLKSVDKNLLYLPIAYNAGPGNLIKWKKRAKTYGWDNDPLFFIETLGSEETRIFVESILRNYWIYQLHLGQEPKSLTTLASGNWPVYGE